MTITKYDLRDKMSEKGKMTKKLSDEMITLLFEIIFDELAQGNKVRLPRIGTLKNFLTKQNAFGLSSTGGKIIIPPKLRMRFSSSKMIKEKLAELLKIQQMEHTSLFE